MLGGPLIQTTLSLSVCAIAYLCRCVCVCVSFFWWGGGGGWVGYSKGGTNSGTSKFSDSPKFVGFILRGIVTGCLQCRVLCQESFVESFITEKS